MTNPAPNVHCTQNSFCFETADSGSRLFFGGGGGSLAMVVAVLSDIACLTVLIGFNLKQESSIGESKEKCSHKVIVFVKSVLAVWATCQPIVANMFCKSFATSHADGMPQPAKLGKERRSGSEISEKFCGFL